MEEQKSVSTKNRRRTYEENVYQPCYMKARLPEDSSETNGSATITISAIDQQLIRLARTINSPATFTIEACLYRSGIISRLDGFQFSMTGITCDAISFTAQLTNDLGLDYAFPNGESTPITTPGVS